ncbi:hypothetical protein SAMN05216252_12178 [Actinacidiphila glaucinigra]|uniref:Uncharacterized protein n=1 Tax=Actinacidiphila glaucinigra TaxID=235986 RepID=A0A239LV84_9ACTN|nr:hypothetical protein SAMN05216252_12178 [Actinacidiphila glaucinigra]
MLSSRHPRPPRANDCSSRDGLGVVTAGGAAAAACSIFASTAAS